MQRGRDLRTAGPKWDESIKFIPPGLRKAHARRIRKILRGRGDGEYQENKTFWTCRTYTHTNSQEWSQHAQGLLRSKPEGVPVLRGEVDISPQP